MTTNTKYIPWEQTPPVPGLTFRYFRGEADYPVIKEIFNNCAEFDGTERAVSLIDIRHTYGHLIHCDPYKDMIFAELKRQPAGYIRVQWRKKRNGNHYYSSLGLVAPQYRRQGIGTAILNWAENRQREIAANHPVDASKTHQVSSDDEIKSAWALFQSMGYQPLRRFYKMIRPIGASLPDAPMPERLEVRPVEESHLRQIWRASLEAFQDHWGEPEPTEEQYQRFISSPLFNSDLWKVAWDGDEVAGMVLNFVDENANQTYGVKRGWTEDISVRRPWRKRGLATALIVESIRMFRELGFEETALGVDTENHSGALKIYEKIGYRIAASKTVYQKPIQSP